MPEKVKPRIVDVLLQVDAAAHVWGDAYVGAAASLAPAVVVIAAAAASSAAIAKALPSSVGLIKK